MTESQRGDLYDELAAGAESGTLSIAGGMNVPDEMSVGWDYTVRWFPDPRNNDGLRSFLVRDAIPTELNSIICTWNRLIPFTKANQDHLRP